MYVDGDGPKLCDGCDQQKERLASIRMICGDVACICKDCIKDILTVWDEGLIQPWYMNNGVRTKNWHNPSPKHMELVEDISFTYTMSKHRMI